ncbi:MAG: aminopeptidase [Ktedonobacteraceae bacterium]|nr:aminopeptidase [Ktedonobacteraceae bacterium]
MADIHLQRMAQVLVHYSLSIKEGDRLGIETSSLAAPLVREVVREAVKAGAHPEIFTQLADMQEILLKEGSDKQVARIPQHRRIMVEEFETLLRIVAEENLKSLNTVDPQRLALAQQANNALMRTMLKRTAERSLRWTLTIFPTHAYAQDADMSLSEFEDFIYHACFLDHDDPVACWQELSQQQQRLIDRLTGKRTIQLLGQDTNLTFSVEGRSWLNDNGHYNFPGGEFFTSPVETSANGSIHFSFPATVNGRSIEDVYLRFEHGVVIEATAAQGQAYLDKMLGLDEGAHRLGEFAFGNNRNVNRSTRNVLFDEKMGRTVHLALGAGYPETGGTNRSALHWDMVYDLRRGSEVLVDGELFCKDGVFVEPSTLPRKRVGNAVS